MSTLPADFPDVMQVCTNGHVITDLLHTCPEQARSHCERCGALTLDHCRTCGEALPGAIFVPGMVPVGIRQAPSYCSRCGGPFPWAVTKRFADAPEQALKEAVLTLEKMLRRLPLTIRQLRSRHGDRPPFRVDDERDLEDLTRAVLPLAFDDIRPHSRTPLYANFTRTDFLIEPAKVAVTVKLAQDERQLAQQWQEDADYYERQRNCSALVGFVYDPQGLLREPAGLEVMGSKGDGELLLRWVISG